MTYSGTFEFRGKIFPYLRSHTLNAGNNELSVEIPIALHAYNRIREIHKDKAKILEIGCVLPLFNPLWIQSLELKGDLRSAYVPHLCVDDVPNYAVVDADLMKWYPEKNTKFDLIVSLNKMSHLFDNKNKVRNISKEMLLIDQIVKMKTWLSSSGMMILTIPFDEPSVSGNEWIDRFLLDMERGIIRPDADSSNLTPTHIIKMKRVGFGIAGNQWKEIDPNSPNKLYDDSVPSASTVYFLIWENHKSIWN